MFSFLLRKLFKNKKTGINKKVSWIIVGIGNNGPEYHGTRHNIGFTLIDTLTQKRQILRRETIKNSKIFTNQLEDEKMALLVKPMTYVNRSGEAIKELLNEYNLPLSSYLVVIDDFNLSLGTIRFKRQGSDGGHNGLKSIISEVGLNFPRLKIGIGPIPKNTNVIDFVLGRFSPQEIDTVHKTIETAADAILFYCRAGIDAAMNTYNN